MLITVFTPTYNRGYIIEELYHSLQMQTYKNFEWRVIDDGSTDNTELLFKNFQNENNFFHISYQKVPNSGKHCAINKGVNDAKGEMFFIVDSDDKLTRTSLESVINWYNTINDKTGFCGVAGLRGYDEKRIIGTTFSNDTGFLDATALEREKYNIFGDKAEVFITNILKKFPFKEFENEKFLTENTVWYEIAGAGYKLRWFNEIIYIGNYLDDGLTKNHSKLFYENIEGEIYTVNIYKKYKKISMKRKIKDYIMIYDVAKTKNIDTIIIARKLNCSILFLKVASFVYKMKLKIINKKV